MRRRAWLALLLALLLGGMPHAALAQGQVAEEHEAQSAAVVDEAEPGTVTGFPEQGPVVRLSVNTEERPSLEELTLQMPETLSVQVDGAPAELRVSWYCVGDWESADDYYYQFSPRWDEERWPLAEGLDVVRDAPYAAVFVTEAGLSAQSAESVELECYSFFVNKMGLNTAAACGILANIYNECSFKPNNLQGSFEKKLGYTDESYTEAVDKGTYKNFVNDGAGYGLVQFTWWELKRDLLAYAKQKGTSIGDTQTQLEYLQISLGAKRTKDLLAIPNTAKGAYQAGKYFCDEYERPGLKEQPVLRAKLARDTFWPRYQNALNAPELVSVKRTPDGARFTWNGVAGAAKYRVYRNDGEGWNKLGDTTQLSWRDEPLVSGKRYAYTVCCVNADGKVVGDLDTEGLSLDFWAAPKLTALKSTAQGVKLRWEDLGCPGYQVWRREAMGTWEELTLVDKASCTDDSAQSGKRYTYTVRCADENGNAISNYQRNRDKKLLYLAAPELKEAGNRGKGIWVSWSAVPGATHYRVCRREADGKWKSIATVKGKQSYTDDSVKKAVGKTYIYTVRAVRGESLSGFQEPGLTLCRLTAPELESVTAKDGTLTVRWKQAAKCRGYEVQLRRGDETLNVSVEGADSLRHRFRDLKRGTWQVRVRAWRKTGESLSRSGWSGTKQVKIA